MLYTKLKIGSHFVIKKVLNTLATITEYEGLFQKRVHF